MTIAFHIHAEADWKYTCTVARTESESEDPQDAAAAKIAEQALCLVLQCIERDEHGQPFLFDQKLARLLGEEFEAGYPSE